MFHYIPFFLSRQKTEALLRYNLYVDCMPAAGLQEIDNSSLQRMIRVARSTARLRRPVMDGHSNTLADEIRLEFTRTMGRILFDKTVLSQPGAFPFVTLPDPYQEPVKETGPDALNYNSTYTLYNIHFVC